MQSLKKSRFDLEDRTSTFARNVRHLSKRTPKSIENMDDFKQVIRSSGSVAANYIEANEAISKADFKYRIKICRKEAKESRFWLKTIFIEKQELEPDREKLVKEAYELELIFGAILRNST